MIFTAMKIFAGLTFLLCNVNLPEVELRNGRSVLFRTNADRRAGNNMEIIDVRQSTSFTAYSLDLWPQRIKTKEAKTENKQIIERKKLC